jgi:hypothetical protein
MSVADRTNEQMIRICYDEMLKADTRELKLHWWARMKHFHRLRTPATVRRLERRMGM